MQYLQDIKRSCVWSQSLRVVTTQWHPSAEPNAPSELVWGAQGIVEGHGAALGKTCNHNVGGINPAAINICRAIDLLLDYTTNTVG